ncbi:NERD domain-containing protein [Streptomyces sp. NPDC059166]|uniref:nuclease-related domain-containing protein n=1 Tax=Streptomyces sp. NPDC059166 TaxID=3346752 RepID=UPI00368E2913
MQDLKVTSWQLFGHDRLYVNLPDGTAIGWADRGNGTITVLHPRYRDAVTDALARQVPDLPALVGEDLQPVVQGPPIPPPVPRIGPVRGLRKRRTTSAEAPAPEATAPAPEAPASAPEAAAPAPEAPASAPEAAAPAPEAPVTVSVRERGPAVVHAPPPDAVTSPRPGAGREAGPGSEGGPGREAGPGPEAGPGREAGPGSEGGKGTGPRTEAVPEVTTAEDGRRRRPVVLPALTAASDLAGRRPGAGLREQLGESGAGTLVRTATAALRRTRETDPRRGALSGERRVGAELRRLTRHGWRLLHSVPLPDGTEIGHLLIGPGGVFAVGTEHHPGESVRVDGGTLRVGDGEPRPYEPGHHQARYARTVLEAYCAFAVPVETVRVFTGAATLEVAAAPAGVRVYGERQVSALAPTAGVLTPTQVERAYDVARNAEAWLEG